MKKLWKIGIVLTGVMVIVPILWQMGPSFVEATGTRKPVPEGVYIDLTKDFYQALRDENATGSKVYSNDPSEAYLNQISISTKFMVETNLQIIKQQDQMIRLLESLLNTKRK